MASSEASPLLRLTFFSVLIIVLFLALFARLWFLQVLAGDRYVDAADRNSTTLIPVDAPRGDILTAAGDPLVQNRPALTVSADRQMLLDNDGAPRNEEAELAIARLAQLLQTDVDDIMERLTSRRYSPFRPVPIAFDVSEEVVFSVQEHQELFPGIVAERLPVRSYPHGEVAAHLVGYLNQISEAELADERFADYSSGDMVGRAGLESSYEEYLRGSDGSRLLEVNAQGRIVDVLRENEPTPGNDLIVSLDVELQAAAESILERGIIASRDFVRDDGRNLPSTAGSAIVVDASDGSILAMASYPTFDPREFVGGLSDEYAQYLYADPENSPQPTINRAIQARYPPGSVYKTVTGAAYVEAGLTTPSAQLPCPSSYEQGGIVFNNWNRFDEGDMDLSDAIMRSCDTYFYDLAYQQWVREDRQITSADAIIEEGDVDEVVPEVARRFGFGAALGIDLPSEAAGYLPDRIGKQNRWLERRDSWCAQAESAEDAYIQSVLEDNCLFGNRWRGGDAINTSIGQGETETTPLQVAMSYLAVGNGGELLRPHLGKQIVTPDGEVVEEFGREVIGDLGVDDATLAALQDGLERVVMDERGTAREAFAGFPLDQIPVAGKTGTAEQRPKVPYAWFAAYAPADDPEYVVVVSVEEGGGGSQTAAPIARGIFEHLYGITPVDEFEFELGPEILD